MAAVIVEIAEAVKDALNAATLSQVFTASRVYVPVHELRDLKDLTVSVVPVDIENQLLDRRGDKLYTHHVDIGIQRVIGQGRMTDDEINAAVDPLMQLAQEMIDLFFPRELPIPTPPVPRCTDAQNRPIFAPAHLDEKRVFTSLVTLGFKQGR